MVEWNWRIINPGWLIKMNIEGMIELFDLKLNNWQVKKSKWFILEIQLESIELIWKWSNLLMVDWMVLNAWMNWYLWYEMLCISFG